MATKVSMLILARFIKEDELAAVVLEVGMYELSPGGSPFFIPFFGKFSQELACKPCLFEVGMELRPRNSDVVLIGEPPDKFV